MSCSTLFTLILLPAFLRLGERVDVPQAIRQRAWQEAHDDTRFTRMEWVPCCWRARCSAQAQNKMVTLAEVAQGRRGQHLGQQHGREPSAGGAQRRGQRTGGVGCRVRQPGEGGGRAAAPGRRDLRLSLEQARAEQSQEASNLATPEPSSSAWIVCTSRRAPPKASTTRRYDVEQAELAEQLARVQVRQIEEQLRRSRIFAPFDGVVNEHFVQPGSTWMKGAGAGAGQSRRAGHPAAGAHRLGPATGRPDPAAGGGEQLSSHAVYYQRAASADPKSRLIELRLRPEPGRFIINSPVRVALPMGERQTMLLPRDALVLGTGERGLPGGAEWRGSQGEPGAGHSAVLATTGRWR